MKKLCVRAMCAALVFTLGAEPLSFAKSDADYAYAMAGEMVKAHPVRLSGTPASVRCATWISINADKMAGTDKFTDKIYDSTHQFANAVLEIKSTVANAPWVILISHFDTAPNIGEGFEGANDGASTTGLLMSMAKVLRRADERKFNFLLCWTDGEECRISYAEHDGFQGSKRLLNYVKEKKYDVKAVICLDMLGDKDLNIEIPYNATAELRKLAVKAAKKSGTRKHLSLRNSIVVKDDHTPFLEAGYPAIDFIDFDYGSARGKCDYWHTAKDTMDKISADSLFISGKLLCEFITLLSE